jgi:hypothetical protein
MNRLLKHQGLSFNAMLPPPPIFRDFPEYTTSGDEDEGEKDTGSPLDEGNMHVAQSKEDEDTEPLSAKMATLRKEAAVKKSMETPTPVRVRRKTTAGRSVRRPADLSSGSDTDSRNASDSTIPEAEEESAFSDDE